MAFFSLILPCYNVEKYVERCVRSILSQRFDDYEIILVDDGAKDGTPEICDRLAAENGGIRVIHKENGGLSSARNEGLAAAEGAYVWFIDSDDWIESDALETLYAACRAGEPEIVKFSHCRADGKKRNVSGIVPEGWYEGDAALKMLRREAFTRPGKYGLSAWSHAYRRDFLMQAGLTFVSERIVCSEDYLFNLTALDQVRRLRVIGAPLYTYELRPGSLTQTYKPDLAQRYAELHRRLRENSCTPALADRFYVWHLAAGTCIPHEYRSVGADRPMAGARNNVRALLKGKALRQAVRRSDKRGLSWQKYIQLAAMLCGFEPLFYYLHVAKPASAMGRAKGLVL